MPLGIILVFEISSTTFIPGEVTTDAWLRPLPNLDLMVSLQLSLRQNPSETLGSKGL